MLIKPSFRDSEVVSTQPDNEANSRQRPKHETISTKPQMQKQEQYHTFSPSGHRDLEDHDSPTFYGYDVREEMEVIELI